MAVKDRATLLSDANTFLTDNNNREITGGQLRGIVVDMIDSFVNSQSDATMDNYVKAQMFTTSFDDGVTEETINFSAAFPDTNYRYVITNNGDGTIFDVVKSTTGIRFKSNFIGDVLLVAVRNL